MEFDRDPLEASLKAATGADSLVRVSEGKWRLESGSDTDLRPVIFSFAVANNLTVLSMNKAESNLEEVFMEAFDDLPNLIFQFGIARYRIPPM